MEETLADYEKLRNEASMADYQLNLDRARFTQYARGSPDK
jgi:hypothetical protein